MMEIGNNHFVEFRRGLVLGGGLRIRATIEPDHFIMGNRGGINVSIATIRNLNQLNIFVANLQIATSRNPRRQIRRIGAAQHFAAFARRFDP